MIRCFKPFLGCYLLVIFVLSAGCSSIQRPNKEDQSTQVLPTSITQLAQKQALACWNIKGKIGVVPKEPSQRKGGSANLNWTQHHNHYSIQLNGPFGSGRVEIEGTIGGTVKITDPEGNITKSSSANDLLYKTIGWRLPVEQFSWWVRGIPAPTEYGYSLIQVDEQGHLKVLEQTPWQVEFPQNQAINSLILPRRVRAHHNRVKVKMSLNLWKPLEC